MTRSDAVRLATNLLREFQLKGLVPNDWTFGFNRGRNMLGCCKYDRKEISLSEYYIERATKEEIEDAVRHELGHIIAGPQAGHGPLWQAACKTTEAKPLRCSKNIDMPSKYVAKCGSCGTTFKANRRLKQMDKRMCAKPVCRVKGMYLKWYVTS